MPRLILPSILEAGHKPEQPRSPKWPAVQRKFLAAHPFCFVCGCRTSLNVHHIRPFHLFPEDELLEENLATLGECCPTGNHHLLFGHLGNWQSYNVDVVAMAAAMLDHFRRRPKVQFAA